VQEGRHGTTQEAHSHFAQLHDRTRSLPDSDGLGGGESEGGSSAGATQRKLALMMLNGAGGNITARLGWQERLQGPRQRGANPSPAEASAHAGGCRRKPPFHAGG
jgi:hypothetical protein